MSLNVYQNECLKNNKQKFIDILKHNDIKILFTQENPPKKILNWIILMKLMLLEEEVKE